MGTHWGDGDRCVETLQPLPENWGPPSIHHNRLGRRNTQPVPANVTVLQGIGGTTVFRSSIGSRITESGPLD